MWINKFIAHTGKCSRREADLLVENGKVTINGEVAQKTQHVFENDIVKIEGEYLDPPKPHRIYIALNKPVGVVCSTEANIANNIIEFVGHEERIFPIGRMDVESQGLILLTNDGDIVSRFTDEKFGVEKEYYVRVDKKITNEFIDGLMEGVMVSGKLVKPIRIKRISPRALRITIVQEMRRQIRRMFARFHYRVFKLERVRIAHIHVRDIPIGDWRYLTKMEVLKMFQDLSYHPSFKWRKPGDPEPEFVMPAKREFPTNNQPRFNQNRPNNNYPPNNNRPNNNYPPNNNRPNNYPPQQGGYQQRPVANNRYNNQGPPPPQGGGYQNNNRYNNQGPPPPQGGGYQNNNRYNNQGPPPQGGGYQNNNRYNQGPPQDGGYQNNNRYNNQGPDRYSNRQNNYQQNNRYDNNRQDPNFEPRNNEFNPEQEFYKKPIIDQNPEEKNVLNIPLPPIDNSDLDF
jgi:23S rRNA pseudouridine2604 synthase